MIKLSEKLCKDYIVRAYVTACKSGFHDKELSVEHMMMLVLSEISEAVEADRKGQRADYAGYEACLKETGDALQSFSKFAKGSVEDELADVAIRLFDFCGALCIVPDLSVCDDALYANYCSLCSKMSFCECCFVLSAIICRCDGAVRDEICTIVGSALTFLFCMCEEMDINILHHIDMKMVYNANRPRLHGKKY